MIQAGKLYRINPEKDISIFFDDKSQVFGIGFNLLTETNIFLPIANLGGFLWLVISKYGIGQLDVLDYDSNFYSLV